MDRGGVPRVLAIWASDLLLILFFLPTEPGAAYLKPPSALVSLPAQKGVIGDCPSYGGS